MSLLRMARASQGASNAYLEASAQVYASKVPSMAAHLMAQRNSLPPTQTRIGGKCFGCCPGCCSILLPGLTSITNIESIATSRRKRERSEDSTAEPPTPRNKGRQKWIKVTCKNCHRYQKIGLNVEKTARSNQRPSVINSSLHAVTPSSLSQASKPADLNQSSKQRAKARKQGLSTLLEKSKQSKSEAGGGLNLMDLMKETDSKGP